MEIETDASALDDYGHEAAHREYKRLLARFRALAGKTPNNLVDTWCDAEHPVRQRIGEIRRDLCYSSHDPEAWQIVKYRVKDKLANLHSAYESAVVAFPSSKGGPPEEPIETPSGDAVL